ncbi:conserved hypothetical protein [Methanocella paludicola SANAE]|uniref:Uncharacterized protein n=1 Tax=Methanocella paludicola (strain DSM 17711 / JCM 13418 / NBRC 101707 / SANAE) TaxID=304371 RepID=D1Z1K2_METPS|nr:hypothetical protein [Methanocella paludicola]BAI62574.1 conserved hypothetical protein [Methanocella paludicola SANAE]
MRYDEFEQLLSRLGIGVVPKGEKRIRGHDVDTYRGLAKRTGAIDFDCGDGESFCRYIHVREGACCQDCVDTCGHWQREGRTLDEDSARKMASFCDARDGFCREGAGCILPRELRSPVCLYHICSDAKMTEEDKELLRKIKCGTDLFR